MFKASKAEIVGLRPAHKVSRNFPVEYYVLAGVEFRGAIVGYLSDRPIREAAIDADGERYRFVGIAPRDINGRYDVFALERGEWIVEPGLVYVIDQGETAGRAERGRAASWI